MREAGLSKDRETARRIAVLLLFVFYVLLLTEGALRKWLLPGVSNALVFVRDPVMLAILAIYARLGASAPMRRILIVYGLTVGALIACAAGQLATSPVPALAILAGFRNYVLFIPLCCVIHDAFTRRDYAGWIRLNLWLALPVAGLVVAQYRAGPGAWINAVPGGGDDGTFLLVEDVVRPYGLFSFTLGHSAFAAWMLGVVLAATAARHARATSRVLLACGSVGVVGMVAFSGSRTCLLLSASVLAVFSAFVFSLGRAAPRRLTAGIIAALATVTTAVLVVEPSIAADLLDRQATATASEGATGDRIASVLTGFVDELGRAPMLGYGLGSGTNIANYLSNGRTDHVLAEYELTRIVQELGPFCGIALILLRWGLVAWFVVLAAEAARRGNLQPACYLGFLAPVFLAHDITLQNSMIGIAWFAAGVFLAAVRHGVAEYDRRPELRPALNPSSASTDRCA